MQSAPKAAVGRIEGRWWPWATLPLAGEVTFANFPLAPDGDEAILCRTNAPLIMLHYKLLARGIPSKLKGGREVTKDAERVRFRPQVVHVPARSCSSCLMRPWATWRLPKSPP